MPDRPLVLLFGITPRSGTNYFYNLLRQHPELACVTSEKMPEDFLIYHSDLLLRYADLVSSWWTQHWRPGRDPESTAEDRERSFTWLAKCLGDGITSALAGRAPSGELVVTKTPTVHNLHNVFDLLPGAKVLILVRDGRDQTASAVRSYGKTHEFAMQRWAEAARIILDFHGRQHERSPSQHMIVRYEDLLGDVERTLGDVFDFLGVDASVYDYSVEARLPVYGSSEHLREGENLRQQYRLTERSADFNPTGRWADWPRARLSRFNYVAGAEMERFGYDLVGPRPRASVVHRMRDVPFRLRTSTLSALRGSERLATSVARYRLKALRFGVDH